MKVTFLALLTVLASLLLLMPLQQETAPSHFHRGSQDDQANAAPAAVVFATVGDVDNSTKETALSSAVAAHVAAHAEQRDALEAAALVFATVGDATVDVPVAVKTVGDATVDVPVAVKRILTSESKAVDAKRRKLARAAVAAHAEQRDALEAAALVFATVGDATVDVPVAVEQRDALEAAALVAATVDDAVAAPGESRFHSSVKRLRAMKSTADFNKLFHLCLQDDKANAAPVAANSTTQHHDQTGSIFSQYDFRQLPDWKPPVTVIT